jgi:hypothetical protein
MMKTDDKMELDTNRHVILVSRWKSSIYAKIASYGCEDHEHTFRNGYCLIRIFYLIEL